MLKPNLRALGTHDRKLAAGFAIYYIFGVLTNYTRTSPRFSEDTRILVASFSLLALVGWIGYFVTRLRQRCPARELGVEVRARRTWPLTAAAALIAAAALARLPHLVPAWIAMQIVVAVVAEELIFRPFLINLLAKLLGDSPRSLRVAVVIGAAIWAAAHIPSKPASQVVGIFIGGLVFGGLYGFSGTNIVGFVVHAAANAGGAAAVTTFCLCVIAGALLGRRRTAAPVTASSA